MPLPRHPDRADVDQLIDNHLNLPFAYPTMHDTLENAAKRALETTLTVMVTTCRRHSQREIHRVQPSAWPRGSGAD